MNGKQKKRSYKFRYIRFWLFVFQYTLSPSEGCIFDHVKITVDD